MANILGVPAINWVWQFCKVVTWVAQIISFKKMSVDNEGSFGEESYGVKIETLQKAESYGEESYQGAASGYDPGGSYGKNPNGVEVSNLTTK